MRLAHGGAAWPRPAPDLSVHPPSRLTTLSLLDSRPQDKYPHKFRLTLNGLERKLGVVEAKVIQDNVIMASNKEEQDTKANRATLNKVTITGINLPNHASLQDQERIALMKRKVMELVDKVKSTD